MTDDTIAHAKDPQACTTASDGLEPGARTLLRGVQRMMRAHLLESLSEVPLPNGRRADVLGISTKSELTIIEIKSSVADFRSDFKWPDYLECCDRFYFAVGADFPLDILPGDTGIIVADAYGAEIVREAPVRAIPAARRKSLTLSFARIAAMRLQSLIDPSAPFG
jgi:hypothetical protein